MNGGPVSVQDKKRCQVWTGMRWELLPVSIVYSRRETVLVRCPECHGPVVLMKESKDGRNMAHFEHRPRHAGCRLVHKWYCGTPSMSPLAVGSPGQAIEFDPFEGMTDEEANEIIGPTVGITEKRRLLLARVGQGVFRERLLQRWGTCSVLGCGPQAVLVASHIVAWRACESNDERLDVNNGLLLTPNLDKLFDRGLVSFADNGDLLVSPSLSRADAVSLGLRPDMRLREVPPPIIRFLSQHRQGAVWRYL